MPGTERARFSFLKDMNTRQKNFDKQLELQQEGKTAAPTRGVAWDESNDGDGDGDGFSLNGMAGIHNYHDLVNALYG